MIQRTDPKTRRRALFLVLALSLLLTIALAGAKQWLAELRTRDPAEALRALVAVLRWGTVCLAVMSTALGLHLFVLGRRVAVTARFPPATMAVLRDTRVLEGASARRRGLIIQAVAISLMVLAAMLPFVAVKFAAVPGADRGSPGPGSSGTESAWR